MIEFIKYYFGTFEKLPDMGKTEMVEELRKVPRMGDVADFLSGFTISESPLWLRVSFADSMTGFESFADLVTGFEQNYQPILVKELAYKDLLSDAFLGVLTMNDEPILYLEIDSGDQKAIFKVERTKFKTWSMTFIRLKDNMKLRIELSPFRLLGIFFGMDGANFQMPDVEEVIRQASELKKYETVLVEKR